MAQIKQTLTTFFKDTGTSFEVQKSGANYLVIVGNERITIPFHAVGTLGGVTQHVSPYFPED